MELMKAHNQWRTRPADQRFKTLNEMHQKCVQYAKASAEREIYFDHLRVESNEDDLYLVGKTGTQAKFNHFSFGQLAQKANAPASYLRELPATLAAQNINYGLKHRTQASDPNAALLFDTSKENLELKAITTTNYKRLWNYELTERLVRIQEQNPNWVNPMAYKVIEAADGKGWPRFSTEMEPAGLYASDHDMFAFLVDESKTLEGSPQGLNRGFFMWNSEVGASSFGVMTFVYDRVCGNNIVWGAKNVVEIRLQHRGALDEKMTSIRAKVSQYLDSSSNEIEGKIKKAKEYIFAGTKEKTLDAIFDLPKKIKDPILSQKLISQAVTIAEEKTERYGEPYSLWALTSGLTEASQLCGHADKRVQIDRAAGKLLNLVEF